MFTVRSIRLARAVPTPAGDVWGSAPDTTTDPAMAVSAASWPGVRDVVGGLRSVLVTVDPVGTDLAEVAG